MHSIRLLRCLVVVAVLCAGACASSTAQAQGFAPTGWQPQYGAAGSQAATDALSRLPPPEDLPLAPPTDFAQPAPNSGIHSETLPDTWLDSAGPPPGFMYHWGAQARGYYINDQRIEFTGEEATFAAEGVVAGGLQQQHGPWLLELETEVFLNQPFDRNILQDTPERASFAHNFDIEPFQISQLYMTARRGDWSATIGRFNTPFGRYYYPLYRNNFDDSPFIRSEAILYRETGLMAEYQPEGWAFAAALTNGGPEQDTNSSKAFVGRAGLDYQCFALGASVKIQDGVGSETVKVYKNHLGVDAMVRAGNWTLSGEAIYDEYGRRRPDLAMDDIFWGRSLYYRDINKAPWEPIEGYGYYVNLGYEGESWSLMLNYGEFYPEQLGHAQHDVTSRRTLIKASRHWTPNWETYAIVMNENDLPNSFAFRTRQGMYMIFGCQFEM